MNRLSRTGTGGESSFGSVDPRITRTRKDVLTATLGVLVDDGSESVTHAHLARVAGYSKATLYKHWPTRADLLKDALQLVGDVEHHRPTGALRADLIAEVTVYRREMEDHRLDRALIALVGLVKTTPELIPVREKLVSDGERVLRELLQPHLDEKSVHAATLMLVGGVLQSVLLHGIFPSDESIAASVDLVMGNFDLAAECARPTSAEAPSNGRKR